MSYKVGATIVIDNFGNIPYSQIVGGPVFAGPSTIIAPRYVTNGVGPNYSAYALTGWEYPSGSTFRQVYTRNTI